MGEEPRTLGSRGTFPEQNTNGLCSKINNRQMGLHINCKASVRKRTLSIRQNSNQQIGNKSLQILHSKKINIQYIQRAQEAGPQKFKYPH
jgi:hypothetical protein